MTVTEIEIASITQDVWRAFVGLEVEGPVPNDGALTRSPDCGASVDIDGPFRGRVVLCCSHPLACEAAALVFDVTPESVDPEMVGELLTEMANQIGGNIKALLPQGCRLSLPKQLSGGADAAGPPAHCLVSFERCGQRFVVALFSLN